MNTDENENVTVVRQFNDALNAADVNAMMALTSKDTVFENTYPAPNGERFEGKEKVRIFWENFFHTSISAQIEIEEIFSFSERCVMFWNYHWKNHHGEAGHIRGVDVYRIENKLIAEKRSYVKG